MSWPKDVHTCIWEYLQESPQGLRWERETASEAQYPTFDLSYPRRATRSCMPVQKMQPFQKKRGGKYYSFHIKSPF